MRIVLDASAAVSAVMDDQPKVFAILDQVSRVFAPYHFIAEVTNGLWKYVVLRGLPVDDAAARLQVALRMVRTYRHVTRFAEEALREAPPHRPPPSALSSAVLPRRENAAILTIDRRLRELCVKMRIPLAH